MGLHTMLKTIDEDVKHWPNKKMKRCTFIGNDNATYQGDILPEEADLILELRRLRSDNVLNQWQEEALIKKIDALMDAKYSEGYDSADLDHEENN